MGSPRREYATVDFITVHKHAFMYIWRRAHSGLNPDMKSNQ